MPGYKRTQCHCVRSAPLAAHLHTVSSASSVSPLPAYLTHSRNVHFYRAGLEHHLIKKKLIPTYSVASFQFESSVLWVDADRIVHSAFIYSVSNCSSVQTRSSMLHFLTHFFSRYISHHFLLHLWVEKAKI